MRIKKIYIDEASDYVEITYEDDSVETYTNTGDESNKQCEIVFEDDQEESRQMEQKYKLVDHLLEFKEQSSKELTYLDLESHELETLKSKLQAELNEINEILTEREKE